MVDKETTEFIADQLFDLTKDCTEGPFDRVTIARARNIITTHLFECTPGIKERWALACIELTRGFAPYTQRRANVISILNTLAYTKENQDPVRRLAKIATQQREKLNYAGVVALYYICGTLEAASTYLGLTRERIRQIMNMGERNGIVVYNQNFLANRQRVLDSLEQTMSISITARLTRCPEHKIHEILDISGLGSEYLKNLKNRRNERQIQIQRQRLKTRYDRYATKLNRVPTSTDMATSNEGHALYACILRHYGSLDRFYKAHKITVKKYALREKPVFGNLAGIVHILAKEMMDNDMSDISSDDHLVLNRVAEIAKDWGTEWGETTPAVVRNLILSLVSQNRAFVRVPHPVLGLKKRCYRRIDMPREIRSKFVSQSINRANKQHFGEKSLADSTRDYIIEKRQQPEVSLVLSEEQKIVQVISKTRDGVFYEHDGSLISQIATTLPGPYSRKPINEIAKHIAEKLMESPNFIAFMYEHNDTLWNGFVLRYRTLVENKNLENASRKRRVGEPLTP